MNEITLSERDAGLLFKEDSKYTIILMYSVGENMGPSFIRAGPMLPEIVTQKVEKMLNDIEQGRFVCINSQFVKADRVIGIKVDVWKDNADRRSDDRGHYYDAKDILGD